MPIRTVLPAIAFIAMLAILGVWGLVTAQGFVRPAEVAVRTGGLASAFEKHYESRFPIKRFGVNLWAAFDYRVLGEGRPGVVLGREGWLFTDEEFKLAETHAAQLTTNLALIQQVKTVLAQRSIQLMVVVVPAKARVYSEFLDRTVPPAAHRVLYAQVMGLLAMGRITTTDLLLRLTAAKQQQATYLRTDTHWTPWGAENAAAAIATGLQAQGLSTDPGAAKFKTLLLDTQVFEGDLLSFLPLAPTFKNMAPAPDSLPAVRTEALEVAEGAVTDDALFGSSTAPRIALVGTSYSANARWNFIGALRNALQEDVSSYAQEGHGPFVPMATFLAENTAADSKPVVVIWELPERSLLVDGGKELPAALLALPQGQ